MRGIRDVVVFSSKGMTPLAAALSGGDYDGDKAWVCWDPRIVDCFNPTPPPPDPEAQSEQDRHYGITRETTTLGDIVATSTDPTLKFLSLSFSFMLQPSVLGFATTTHEKFCYLKRSITHPSSISLATLCGLLVDRPKQGINFPPSAFQKYLRSTLAIPHLPDPAYRNNGRTRRTDHILDHLLFSVAKPLVESSLSRLSSYIENAPLSDLDLTALYKRELHDATSTSDREVTQALQTLLSQISTIQDYWSLHLTPKPHPTTTEPSILHHVTHALSLFSSILPSPTSTHPLLRWRLDALRTPSAAPPSHWALLRASAAFYRHSASRFVWYIAGRELGHLKASASGSTMHTVIGPLYNGYKLDAGYAKRVENRALGVGERTEPVSGRESQEQQEEEADEFDEERWFEREMMAVVEGVEGLSTGGDGMRGGGGEEEEGEEYGGEEMEGEMVEVVEQLGY